MNVRIYTDGAVSPNGHGGWAAVMFVDEVLIDGKYGGAKGATNNTMELQGLIEGMKMLPLIEHLRCENCGVVAQTCQSYLPMKGLIACPIQGTIMRPVYNDAVIISDSQYCVKGATSWVYGWVGNGWKTADKKPVKNQSQWEEVLALTKKTLATFAWVKGHNGNTGNELADQWAVAGKQEMYKVKDQIWSATIPGLET